jgi:hypothetical protein
MSTKELAFISQEDYEKYLKLNPTKRRSCRKLKPRKGLILHLR